VVVAALCLLILLCLFTLRCFVVAYGAASRRSQSPVLTCHVTGDASHRSAF
jgi:hypothetical protein